MLREEGGIDQSKNLQSKPITSRRWLIGIASVLLLTSVCVWTVLPQTIAYLIPNTVYPNSDREAGTSGIEPDASHTKLHLYSHSVFHTADAVEQVSNWYVQKGWKSAGNGQGVGLQNNSRTRLWHSYDVYVEQTVGIMPDDDTQIDLWIEIFLVPYSQ